MHLDSIVRDQICAMLSDAIPRDATTSNFEQALNAVLMECGRQCMRAHFDELAAQGAVVEDAGLRWSAVVTSRLTVRTSFGDVDIERALYRSRRNGPTRCFVYEKAGLVANGWTRRAASIATQLLADVSTRAAASFFSTLGMMSPSRSNLERLPKAITKVVQGQVDELNHELRRGYAIPAEATSFCVSIDGVMVKLQSRNREAGRERARKRGRKAGGPIGSSEASVGAISFYDREGTRLLTRRLARMPEPNKETLKAQLAAEVAEVRRRRPELVLVATGDGAPNNWSFFANLAPDHEVVDAFHTLEHIKRRLDRALKVGSHENQRTYKAMKETLLTVDGGHMKVFADLEVIEKKAGTFKPRKRSGRGAQPTFYERHHARMRFAEHRRLNLPIGSGVIEGTARYMVVDRLRRTGMRWLHQGGQSILDFRVWLANGQHEKAWDLIANINAARHQARARAGGVITA